MKKIVSAVLAAACVLTMSSCSCSGCGNTNTTGGYGSSDDGIYLYSNMSLETVDYDDFDTSKYDVDEYKGFLDDDVAVYNATHDYEVRYTSDNKDEVDTSISAAVTVKKCEMSGKQLETRLLYSSADDVTEYYVDAILERGGTELLAGTLDEAPAEVAAASFVDTKGETVDIASIISDGRGGDYRYVVCDFKADIYGDGSIYAYTSNAEYKSAYKCVSVPAGSLAVVIFKK